ncbi:MAG: MgtC/SapB family protein [Candidatus Eisenbacteria bacterium]|nr:MgtC/SapB family protein [Candidatus Eisenbacteria bacterium]
MQTFWSHMTEDLALLKLVLSLLLGGLIGLERELKGRPAGLRTHVLVCIGSTIMLIAAQQATRVFSDGSSEARLVLDPNRIASGIVTGIGFLGAGAILRMGDFVRGLTTAATIWFVAALGIVIGNDAFGLAAGSTFLVLLVLEGLDYVEHRIPQIGYRTVRLRVTNEKRHEVEAGTRRLFEERGIRVQDVLCSLDLVSQECDLTFHLRARTQKWTADLIDRIASLEGVHRLSTGRV